MDANEREFGNEPKNFLTMNTEVLTEAEPRGRVVTDSPKVVKLKAEFRALDARAEAVKAKAEMLKTETLKSEGAAELGRINGRKAEIGWEIFNLRKPKTFQPRMNTDEHGSEVAA